MQPRQSLCDDSCRYSRDGQCDDSGPGSDVASCKLGTDCSDCGARTEEELGAFMCTNKCRSHNDGQCDDGGPYSNFKTCDFGSDCKDCGARIVGSSCLNGRVKVCSGGCDYEKDGTCDDGGPGSEHSGCTFGSDCEDCGARDLPCSTLGSVTSYNYDAPETASPPPPAQCLGLTPGSQEEPACIFGGCNMNDPKDCRRCICATCPMCSAGAHATSPAESRHVPPPPNPSPPSPSPPFHFNCHMLGGRGNAWLRSPRKFCYSLSTSECELGYVYSHDSDGSPSLSICHLVDQQCEPWHVPANEYRKAECRAYLAGPPAPPPTPSPPPPCLPLAAKCGGEGWSGPTTCCSTPHSEVHCFRRDAQYSQCRTSCRPGWDCWHDASPAQGSARHAPPPHPAWRPTARSPPPPRAARPLSHPPPPPQPSPPRAAYPSTHSKPAPATIDNTAGEAARPRESEGGLLGSIKGSSQIYLLSALLVLSGAALGAVLTRCCCPPSEPTRGAYSQDVRTSDDPVLDQVASSRSVQMTRM